MYRVLRNIHLTLALLALPFLLLYGISAVQMTHGSWFNRKPQVIESHLTASPGTNNARALARELMDRYRWSGEIQQVSETPAGYKLRIARPGTAYEIEYARATGELRVRTSRANLLSGLHRAAGFWHDYWLGKLWSGFVVWASVAIILLGVSGVWMWFVRHQDRVIGIVLLALNLGCSLALLFLIRLASAP